MQRKTLKIIWLYLNISLYFILPSKVSGQYFTSGSDPSRLKWKQIKTPVARIVFEENFKSEALRLASFIDSIAPKVTLSLNHRPSRVDLLIHNQAVISNGFISWAPRRSEFFSTAPQDADSNDWLEHLAIHEYRHIVQADKLNQGFTRFLGYFSGQQAVGAALGSYLPMWFLEGDAVIMETSLSNSGRGSSYEFNRELKAQLTEKTIFSYDKAYLGSYKDFVANYYKMGYILTAVSRQKYGTELWEKVISNCGRNSWMLTPFNRAIRNYTGKNQKQLYNEVFSHVSEQWHKELENQNYSHFKPIINPIYDYANYSHLKIINDTSIAAELNGPGIRQQILSININTGAQKTLVYTGLRNSDPISANHNTVVWSEIENHPRWTHESWSVIKTHQIKTGKTQKLTKQTKYFSPSIHPYKDIIALVESRDDYKFYITIIDAKSGEKIKEYPTPKNSYPLTPSWNRNGENLICVLLFQNGKAIYLLDTDKEHWQQITKPGYDEIRYPIIIDNSIWYTAKGAISDEIFRLDTNTNITTQISSTKFGAMFPAVTSDKSLIFCNYNHKGSYPVIHTDNYLNKTNDKLKSYIHQLAEEMKLQEADTLYNYSSEANSYEVERYSKWNLFNFHSWAPININFKKEAIHTGITVMSQNLLGTAIITAGVNADPAFTHEKYHIDISYRGRYPIFNIGMRTGYSKWGANRSFQIDDKLYRIKNNQKIPYHQLRVETNIPLNFSRGAFSRNISPGTAYVWEQQTGISLPIEIYNYENNVWYPSTVYKEFILPTSNYRGLEYSLYMHNLRYGTSRDVATRFGQVFHGVFRHTPLKGINRGTIAGISSRLYFPGLGKHHAIRLNNDYQVKTDGDRINNESSFISYTRFNDVISYPRGYSSIDNDKLYVFRSTYMLPLYNPDLSIGAFAYIKRLRLNMFYDQAIAQYKQVDSISEQINHYNRKPASFGAELFAETHFFRFVLPFHIGYRIGIRSYNSQVFQELILSTEFVRFLAN